MKQLFNLKFIMLAIAFIQGLFLLFLHSSIDNHFWPYANPQWLSALYTIAILSPFVILLSVKKDNVKKTMIWTLGFSVIVGLIGFYFGLQWVGIGGYYVKWGQMLYAITMTVAGLMFVMFMQQNLENTKTSYGTLLKFSWRNFLTLCLSHLFIGAFLLVLMLWALMFKLIKIDFFNELFNNKYFIYPVLALCNGLGIIILRDQRKIIDVLTRIQQVLMKYLLLVLIFASVIFLCSLLFLGLKPLWDTGFGSGTLLWMQALIIFMFNAAYQEGAGRRPFGIFLHRCVYGGIALLPLYSLIIGYGIFTRIAQYGWTMDRGWSVLVWAIFALFSFSYLWSIIRKGDDFLDKVGLINIRMAFVVFFSLIAVNSPLLDFRKIAVSSQMARLETGALSYENFDYNYFYRNLATPGRQALLEIKNKVKNTHPKVYLKVENVLKGNLNGALDDTIEEFEARLVIVNSSDEILSEDLLKKMYSVLKSTSDKIYILVIDLNDDGQKDYFTYGDYSRRFLFSFVEGKWKKHTLNRSRYLGIKKVQEAFKNNKFEIITPKWNHIKIGNEVIRIDPD